MAIIKKFRNGKPVDPTDPSQNIVITPQTIPNAPNTQISKPKPSTTPSRGGCGCGRK